MRNGIEMTKQEMWDNFGIGLDIDYYYKMTVARETDRQQVSKKKSALKARQKRLAKKNFRAGMLRMAVIMIIAIGIMKIVSGTVLLYKNRAHVPSLPVGYSKIWEIRTMEYGDTLWDIAAREVDEQDIESIYRVKDYVYEIQKVNRVYNPNGMKEGFKVIYPVIKEVDFAE